jgi:hypothetical protein
MLTFPEHHLAKLKGSILNNVYCSKPDGKKTRQNVQRTQAALAKAGFLGTHFRLNARRETVAIEIVSAT